MNAKRKIILIQNWFNSEERSFEYIKCLEKNIKNTHIDEIFLLCNAPLPKINDPAKKINTININHEPTYAEYFQLANILYRDCLCIVSNLDVFFDYTISRIHNYVDTLKVVALSRWNVASDGTVSLMEGAHGSQDAWAFISPLNTTGMAVDFSMGIGGCDHRVAFELAKHHTVLNPCLMVSAFHLHNSPHRKWIKDGKTKIALNAKDGFKMVPTSGSGIISFSLFSVDSQQEHRVWDKYNCSDRYFFNIPAIIAVYKTIYPDFKLRLYVTDVMATHKYFDFLSDLHKNNVIELFLVKNKHVDFEATFLRYIPFFDKTVDFVFSRDLDSLPTTLELAANEYFMGSPHPVCTIRSHYNHNSSCTEILAGLCGIKPQNFPHKTDYIGFFDFYKATTWGVEQEALVNYVCTRSLSDGVRLLDVAVSSTEHTVGVRTANFVDSIDNTALNSLDKDIRSKYPELSLVLNKITAWSGQPVDVRGAELILLLKLSSIGNTITALIDKHNLKEFYKI